MFGIIRRLLKRLEHLISLYINLPSEKLPEVPELRYINIIGKVGVRDENPIRAGPKW